MIGKLYIIKKSFLREGKKVHVFVTNGYSEILELKGENIANEFCRIMNENSENNCSYKVIETGTNK